MQPCDNVLINFTKQNRKQLATFKECEDGYNLFTDVHGDFILTDKFIKENEIVLTVIED